MKKKRKEKKIKKRQLLDPENSLKSNESPLPLSLSLSLSLARFHSLLSSFLFIVLQEQRINKFCDLIIFAGFPSNRMESEVTNLQLIFLLEDVTISFCNWKKELHCLKIVLRAKFLYKSNFARKNPDLCKVYFQVPKFRVTSSFVQCEFSYLT